MAKNKIKDLNDLLFAQLERLSDETLKPEELQVEIERSRAMSGLAKNVIDVGRVVLSAHVSSDSGWTDLPPKMLQDFSDRTELPGKLSSLADYKTDDFEATGLGVDLKAEING
jgi:hypothetical protein